MKKDYEKPDLKIIKFNDEDIILTSGTWNLPGEDKNPESGADDIF